MRVIVISIFLGLFVLGACAPVATPLPQPTATATTIPTETVSAQQMTEAVNFRMTLPPSFTPTFTPSASPTSTSTFTPTPTATATTIPTDVLCESFTVSNTFIENQQREADIGKVLLYEMPFSTVTIVIEIINVETGEIIQEGTLDGGEAWTLDYRASNFPQIGDYEWRATLIYQGETGLCELTGEFSTTPADLGTVTPEMTAEVTPELTPELTAEATSEMIVESTAEVTEVVEIAPQATPQLTPTVSFQFPPR